MQLCEQTCYNIRHCKGNRQKNFWKLIYGKYLEARICTNKSLRCFTLERFRNSKVNKDYVSKKSKIHRANAYYI